MEGDHNSARKRGSSWEISGYQRVSVFSMFISFQLVPLFRSSISPWSWEDSYRKDGKGGGKTYPPYFNTVISGIAAPNGKLLLGQHLHFNTNHNGLFIASRGKDERWG
jgi:hypothetical protein